MTVACDLTSTKVVLVETVVFRDIRYGEKSEPDRLAVQLSPCLNSIADLASCVLPFRLLPDECLHRGHWGLLKPTHGTRP